MGILWYWIKQKNDFLRRLVFILILVSAAVIVRGCVAEDREVEVMGHTVFGSLVTMHGLLVVIGRMETKITADHHPIWMGIFEIIFGVLIIIFFRLVTW